MKRRAWFLGKAILVLAVVALAAGLVMVLWNTVAIAALSGAHSLDYVHAQDSSSKGMNMAGKTAGYHQVHTRYIR